MGTIDKQYQDQLKAGVLISDPAQEAVLAKLNVLALALGKKPRRFGRTVPARGLYVHGAVGRGKSMLMDLFFATTPVVKKRRVHFNAFMLDVHARLAAARAGHNPDPLTQVAAELANEIKLLCFDEFQVSDVVDAMILARLFTGLIDRGVVMVATSNVAPNDLYKGGLQRELFLPFIAVLKARLEIVAIDDGVDHRLARLTGRPLWFHPDDASAKAAIDQLFADFTAGEWPMTEVLDVGGRALVVPLAAGRIARFTFDQLCRQPLAAADYLALAARFSLLIVEHIPRIDPASRDEAARFVSLVDQLYDRHTGLIASAETTAQDLYPVGGPYGFEFARTVSRLAEMGSAGYFSQIN